MKQILTSLLVLALSLPPIHIHASDSKPAIIRDRSTQTAQSNKINKLLSSIDPDTLNETSFLNLETQMAKAHNEAIDACLPMTIATTLFMSAAYEERVDVEKMLTAQTTLAPQNPAKSGFFKAPLSYLSNVFSSAKKAPVGTQKNSTDAQLNSEKKAPQLFPEKTQKAFEDLLEASSLCTEPSQALSAVQDQITDKLKKSWADLDKNKIYQSKDFLVPLKIGVHELIEGMNLSIQTALHTDISDLADKEECSGDLLIDGTIQKYLLAVITPTPPATNEVPQNLKDAFDALTEFQKQLGCISPQQSYQLDLSLMVGMALVDKRFHEQGMEQALAKFRSAVSSLAFLIVDANKIMGPTPSYHWLTSQTNIQAFSTRALFPNGMIPLYNKKAGALEGVRVCLEDQVADTKLTSQVPKDLLNNVLGSPKQTSTSPQADDSNDVGPYTKFGVSISKILKHFADAKYPDWHQVKNTKGCYPVSSIESILDPLNLGEGQCSLLDMLKGYGYCPAGIDDGKMAVLRAMSGGKGSMPDMSLDPAMLNNKGEDPFSCMAPVHTGFLQCMANAASIGSGGTSGGGGQGIADSATEQGYGVNHSKGCDGSSTPIEGDEGGVESEYYVGEEKDAEEKKKDDEAKTKTSEDGKTKEYFFPEQKIEGVFHGPESAVPLPKAGIDTGTPVPTNYQPDNTPYRNDLNDKPNNDTDRNGGDDHSASNNSNRGNSNNNNRQNANDSPPANRNQNKEQPQVGSTPTYTMSPDEKKVFVKLIRQIRKTYDKDNHALDIIVDTFKEYAGADKIKKFTNPDLVELELMKKFLQTLLFNPSGKTDHRLYGQEEQDAKNYESIIRDAENSKIIDLIDKIDNYLKFDHEKEITKIISQLNQLPFFKTAFLAAKANAIERIRSPLVKKAFTLALQQAFKDQGINNPLDDADFILAEATASSEIYKAEDNNQIITDAVAFYDFKSITIVGAPYYLYTYVFGKYLPDEDETTFYEQDVDNAYKSLVSSLTDTLVHEAIAHLMPHIMGYKNDKHAVLYYIVEYLMGNMNPKLPADRPDNVNEVSKTWDVGDGGTHGTVTEELIQQAIKNGYGTSNPTPKPSPKDSPDGDFGNNCNLWTQLAMAQDHCFGIGGGAIDNGKANPNGALIPKTDTSPLSGCFTDTGTSHSSACSTILCAPNETAVMDSETAGGGGQSPSCTCRPAGDSKKGYQGPQDQCAVTACPDGSHAVNMGGICLCSGNMNSSGMPFRNMNRQKNKTNTRENNGSDTFKSKPALKVFQRSGAAEH